MKRLIIIPLLLLSVICLSQNNIPEATYSKLDINSMECKIELMELGLNKDVSKHYGLGSSISNHLINYIDTLNNKCHNYAFLNSNKDNLSLILHNFGTGKHDRIFWMNTKSNFPVMQLKYKNNSDALIFTNLFTPETYNTLKFNEKERARKVISSYLLDLVTNASRYDFKANNSIKYIGCGVCYTIDDFSNRKLIGVNPEFLFIIFPINSIKQFALGRITEDELIISSDIFMSKNGSSILQKINPKSIL